MPCHISEKNSQPVVAQFIKGEEITTDCLQRHITVPDCQAGKLGGFSGKNLLYDHLRILQIFDHGLVLGPQFLLAYLKSLFGFFPVRNIFFYGNKVGNLTLLVSVRRN